MSTVPAVPTPGGAVAIPSDLPEGLEDFDLVKDGVMPTLRIDHKQNCFVDALSGEEIPVLQAVLLGLVKQRILWATEVEDDAKPLCKSFDFAIGRPDPANFPWAESGFDPALANQENVTLPCEGCHLKNWGSYPGRDTPWCSEQHTFALLRPMGDGYAPALLTVQRSAIKPSRTYMSSFANSKTPLYTVLTNIALEGRKRGNVDFSVPKFQKADPTPTELYPYFASEYRSIREFVQTPRQRNEDEDDGPRTTAPVAPSAAAAPAPNPSAPAAAPAAAAAPATAAPAGAPSADEEDELPF